LYAEATECWLWVLSFYNYIHKLEGGNKSLAAHSNIWRLFLQTCNICCWYTVL